MDGRRHVGDPAPPVLGGMWHAHNHTSPNEVLENVWPFCLIRGTRNFLSSLRAAPNPQQLTGPWGTARRALRSPLTICVSVLTFEEGLTKSVRRPQSALPPRSLSISSGF